MRLRAIITTLLIEVMVFQNGQCNVREKNQAGYYNPHSYSNYDSDYYGQSNINYFNPLDYPLKCKPAKKCVDPNTLNIVDTYWMKAPRTYYITAGTCVGYLFTANTFLGRPARSMEELTNMCTLMIRAGKKIYFQGFNTQYQSDCYKIRAGGRNCTINRILSDIDYDASPLNKNPRQVYPVLTDERTFTVFVRCYNFKLDISVLSTKPFLEDNVIRQVMKVADELGIPQSELLMIPCRFPVSRFPFQANLQLDSMSRYYYSHYCEPDSRFCLPKAYM